MESNFQIGAGEGDLIAPITAVNEAYLNGLYAGMNFASALNTSPFVGEVAAFHPFSPTSTTTTTLLESTTALVPYGNAYNFCSEMETPEMNLLKQEVLEYAEVFDVQKINRNDELCPNSGVPLINFFSNSDNSGMYEANDFGRLLPLLESAEHHHLFETKLPQKSATNFSPINLRSTEPSSFLAKPKFTGVINKASSFAKRLLPYKRTPDSKRHRQKLSERTRCLQKVLPWDKRMDTATLLEESYKYIKFLQAQVIALQSMPPHAGNDVMKNDQNYNTDHSEVAVHGKLGKLNRQQLLQVVVNSPAAQTVLYSRGCCIYSVEQLDVLKEMVEKKAFLEQMLLNSFP